MRKDAFAVLLQISRRLYQIQPKYVLKAQSQANFWSALADQRCFDLYEGISRYVIHGVKELHLRILEAWRSLAWEFIPDKIVGDGEYRF